MEAHILTLCLSALGPTRPVTLFTFVGLLSCIIFSFFGLCLKKLQPRKPSSYQVSMGSPFLLPPCVPSPPWGVCSEGAEGLAAPGSEQELRYPHCWGIHTVAPHPWTCQHRVVL